jgi:rubrerythrin
MVPQLTLREVMEEAINKAILLRFLYVGLRQRVKRQETKDAFQNLAEQEEVHQRVLEDYLRGKFKEGTLNPGLVVDYKIAEYLNQPEITPTMELKEVFRLTANREYAYYQLYLNLAAIHPNGHVKQLLEEMAAQELEHKSQVEALYKEFPNPQ